MAKEQPGMGEHRKSNYDLHSNTTITKNGKPAESSMSEYSKKDIFSTYGKGNGAFKNGNILQHLERHIDEIIKIQATFRGYQSRKYMSMLRSKQAGSSKYFTYEESKETMSKKQYNPN